MKIYTLLFALLISSTSLVFSQKETVKGKKIKPKHHVGIVKMQGKKTLTYYALSEKERTELVVMGPGKLDVLLRVRLQDSTKTSNAYIIHYILNDVKSIIDTVAPEKASKNLKYKDIKISGVPSKASKIEINIPPGKHKIKFYKEKTDEKIHVEFKYRKEKNEPIWTMVSPIQKLDTVKIKYLNKKITYKTFFRISNDKKFIITSNDSLQLKINIKAELDFRALVGSSLILNVIEKGKIIKSYKIKCKESQKTEYVDDKKRIPGNSNIIYLNLPKGNHTYEFALADKNKSAIIYIEKNEKLLIKTKRKP